MNIIIIIKSHKPESSCEVLLWNSTWASNALQWPLENVSPLQVGEDQAGAGTVAVKWPYGQEL